MRQVHKNYNFRKFYLLMIDEINSKCAPLVKKIATKNLSDVLGIHLATILEFIQQVSDLDSSKNTGQLHGRPEGDLAGESKIGGSGLKRPSEFIYSICVVNNILCESKYEKLVNKDNKEKFENLFEKSGFNAQKLGSGPDGANGEDLGDFSGNGFVARAIYLNKMSSMEFIKEMKNSKLQFVKNFYEGFLEKNVMVNVFQLKPTLPGNTKIYQQQLISLKDDDVFEKILDELDLDPSDIPRVDYLNY
jgi:hypothetical protein